MTPQEYCRDKAGRSGSSFYYSFLFLPPARRDAITALYAFCREVDDAVDECSTPEIARVKLAWWHQEIRRGFSGDANHPVMQALVPAIETYGLAEPRFHEIVDGMEMDLEQVRYSRFEDLRLYCHRVAGVVGLLSAAIFGYRHADTLKFAEDLGIAFQLTNIIRDVGEDARRNRIYLPAEDLERFGVAAADILQGRETDAFRQLMGFESARAHAYYESALRALGDDDRFAQTPSLIMTAIYRANLREIEADGFKVLRQKTTLPALRKLWLAWRTARAERRLHRARIHSSPNA